MAERFDKLTEKARQVLLFAQEEAVRLDRKYIGAEHFLLALIRENHTVANVVLGNLVANLDQARSALVSAIGRGDRPVSGEIALTPESKATIEFAFEEANRRGHEYVDPGHLLLGLSRAADDNKIWEIVGVSSEAVREEVGRIYSAARSSPEMPHQMPATVIDGKAIAERVRAEARERALALHAKGIIPGLALVLVGENASSMSYVRSKGDAAEQAGLYSDTFRFAESTGEETVTSRILELNRDQRFHGILVQLPLPKQMREDVVMNCIDPTKDADGVTAASLGHLLRGEPCPWPATPAGVIELLHRSGNPPAGKHVVICGRSNIVGKPLAGILMQKNERANATVTMCHTGTPDLARHTRQADILIAAMGRAGAITADMVKPGAVVIDIGNNWTEDPSRKSGRRLVGDVDYEGVRQVASAITPVPGGVGPMTVAMLISNTIWLAERYG